MKKLIIILILLPIVASIASCSKENSFSPKDTDNIWKPDPTPDSIFSFLHYSDLHSSTATVKAANYYSLQLKNSCTINSGDMEVGNEIPDEILMSPVPVLTVPGNHDVYDYGQYKFRTYVMEKLQPCANVTFGSEKANYWTKDFQKGGYSYRFIGLDEFENNAEGVYFDHGMSVFTQEQIDWFIKTLEGSADFDGVVVVLHSMPALRDLNNKNEFVSELAKNFPHNYDYYSYDDRNIIPDIIESYSTGKNIDKSYYSKNRQIHVTTNFSTLADNFIAYLGGHLHYDIVEYLLEYPSQIVALVASPSYGYKSEHSDLSLRDANFLLNLYSVNPKRRQLKIQRIGASTTDSGALRREITLTY